MRKMELALAAFLAAAGALGDESVKFSGYVSSDITSSYVLYGARINKDPALQTYIEDEVSELLLDGALHEGDSIIVDHEAGNDKLTYNVQHNG